MTSYAEDSTQPSPQGSTISLVAVAERLSAVEASYIVVHRVQCNGQREFNHKDHETELDYLDTPRLLTDANQTSVLKGTEPLDNIEWYLDDNPGRHLAVISIYDCVQYHKEIANEFERLSLPSSINGRTLSQLRPYLYVLRKDAKEADRKDQILVPSPGLKRALNSLRMLHPSILDDWELEENLTYPYPQLWHSRHFLLIAAEDLSPGDQCHITTLWRYLDNDMIGEWTEAEDMFKEGIVSKQHWTKLFHPNELIVTMLYGEPRAFICKDNPEVSNDKLYLECWSWEFDGQFFRRDLSFIIDWPGQSDVASIVDLSHYPLKFDTFDLANRLAKRGATFWSCRQRKYVSYRSPSQSTIGQTVSSCHTCFKVASLISTGSITLHGRHGHLQRDASTRVGVGVLTFHAARREHNARSGTS